MCHVDGEKQISALLHFAKQIIDGNYLYKPDQTMFGGIYKDMYEAISVIGKKMRRYVFEVQVASSQVLSATDELMTGLSESAGLTKALFDEALEIQKLNTGSQSVMISSMSQLKEIAAVLNQVNSISDQVKLVGNQSNAVLKEGKNEILEIVGSVEGIKQSTDNTAEYINRLKQSTDEIDDILKSVSNISHQIKIISLNAAIESARLGTDGKAFAVITEHIKSLSSKTEDEVELINELIAKINKDMTHLEGQIKQNLEHVQKSVICSKNTENSLDRIEQSHLEVQNMIHAIMKATAAEGKLAGEINTSVNDVEMIAHEMANGFGHVFRSISRQKENFEELSVLGNSLLDASNSLSVLNEKADANLIEQNSDKFAKQANTVFSVFGHEILPTPEFYKMNQKTHKEKLDSVLSQCKSIEAIWTNNKKGRFIYSNPPAGIANAKVREWFAKSIKGETYISGLYISAITKNPCITVSMPILDETGQIVGVIGADLKLKV